jgi:response regulator RpfG family c-di-GMP phosphodiesterase
MARLDRESLRKVTVFIGEKNYYERQQTRDVFLAQGVKAVVCHATAASLRTMLLETPPDMLVLSDDFDPEVFDLIREIRHQKVGDNPFMLITVTVAPGRREALTQAIKAGVDDIVIKPLTAERVRERMSLVAFHRQPFVAHGEYIGPDRRAVERPVRLKRIAVLNTLLEKVNGRDFDKDSLKAAIDQSLEQVLQAQLDSQSSRLGELCERLVHAYDRRDVGEDVQSDLMILSNVLHDAAAVAQRLKETSLGNLCKQLSESVQKMADHYAEPLDAELELLRKITAAFQLAVAGSQKNATEDSDGGLSLATG